MTPSFPLRENVPLAPLTTFALGGPARYFAEVHTLDDVRAALAWARAPAARPASPGPVAVRVLGGGSNLLVADRGVDALVLAVHLRGVDVYTPKEVYTSPPPAGAPPDVYTSPSPAGAPPDVYTSPSPGGAPPDVYTPPFVDVTAGAGEPWDPFVARCVAEGWAGLECLSGIPGSVGATPIQNVGAYGQEVADTVLRVEAIDRATGDLVTLPASECAFAYRDSAFKRALAGRFVVTRVTFRLRPGGPPALRYAELTRALAATSSPTLADVRRTILSLRRAKSMVYDPADENHRSAGSFFTNPLVDAPTLAAARAAASRLAPGQTMPEYPAERGLTKLSAAWLIERSGFPRGARDGEAGLSTRHTLALVNHGRATASDILSFATKVKHAVLTTFGVRLTPEAELIGFAPTETAPLLD